jgi:hypothetical protein
MKMVKTIPSVAAALSMLALTTSAVLADPTHHEASETTPQHLTQLDLTQATQGSMPSAQTAKPGMMGQGMGSGMMGPDMMRMMQIYGPGSGTMGMGFGPCGGMAGAKDLSAEQVKDILQGHIAWTGNKRVKVGKIEKKDDETYLAEIVTVDNSLVQKIAVDRNSGAMQPVN